MKIAYTRPDGGVSIVHAAAGEDLARVIGQTTVDGARVLGRDEYRVHVLARSIPEDATDVTILPDDWTPPDDRSFRGAWDLVNGEIGVNMGKARAIQMGQIRAARDAKLRALDVETIRAVGAGDDKRRAVIEEQKQTLRDIPQTFDLGKAETPEALRLLWPEALDGNH